MHARIMCMYVVCWLRCLRKLIARARGVYVIRLFIFIVVNSPLWRPHLKFSWRRFPLSHSHSHYIVYDIFRLPRAPLHKWKLAPFICVLIKRTEVCILLEAHNHAQLTSPSHVSRFQNLWCTDDRRPLPARPPDAAAATLVNLLNAHFFLQYTLCASVYCDCKLDTRFAKPYGKREVQWF